MESPSEPLEHGNVAKCFAARDIALSPNLTTREIMEKRARKLLWEAETDTEWDRRVTKESLQVFQEFVNSGDRSKTVDDIVNIAIQRCPIRKENKKLSILLKKIEEGHSLEELYKSEFSLDDLIYLGW